MRSRSVGILADNMDDYLSQLKQTEETFDNDFIKYQLFNFDFLSLADTSSKQNIDEIYNRVPVEFKELFEDTVLQFMCL